MKNKGKPLLIGILIVAAVLLVGLGGYLYSGDVANTVFGQGFTVLSISPSQVISNDADLAAANFIVTTTLDGAGQSVVGRLSPTQFASETDISGTPYTPSYDFEFGAKNIKQSASYPIQSLNQPF